VSAAPLVTATDLDVGRSAPLIRGVELALVPGECWFLLGRNGSGKSTLIATLLGLLPPLRGGFSMADAVSNRSGLGFVPQETGVGHSLPITAAEYVWMGLGETRRAQASARVQAALASMGVADLAHRDVSSLSFGQRRRVMVARALVRMPVLLVLDEPAASLDPDGSHRLAADLESLRRERGLCILHASHDLGLARAFATHIALVHDGVLTTQPAAAAFAGTLLRETLGGGR